MKAVRKARTGTWKGQAKKFRVEVKSGAYRETGNWFIPLRDFPGALFDANGYIRFESKQEYENAGKIYLYINKQIGIRPPYKDISTIPVYVCCVTPDPTASPELEVESEGERYGKLKSSESVTESLTDLDIVDLVNLKMEAEEGRKILMNHLIRERNRTLISQKKEQVRASGKPLACEICGFVFAEKYCGPGADYCEVHHLIPLSEGKGRRKTPMQDLAIVCANCHRVIHRKMPPFSLEEVRGMLIG
jgi:hypothetical protein